MKIIAAILSFLFMWFFVSLICGFAIAYLFPRSGPMAAGLILSLDWRTWPGTILGVAAGLHSARAALRPKTGKLES